MAIDTNVALPVTSASRPSGSLSGLIAELEVVRAEMLRFERSLARRVPRLHPSHDDSARNLLHYLALRNRDLRSVQLALRALGLSSLGRAEAHARATVEAVLGVLRRLNGTTDALLEAPGSFPGFQDGREILENNTCALLGPARPGRQVRVMVTMPPEAANDVELVSALIERGMDCARINCAHDDAHAWERMITNVREAALALGQPCRILMDLAGPKLRTGPVLPGPAVVKIRPERDELGRLVRPALVWLQSAQAPSAAPAPADATLPLEDLAGLEAGDVLDFVDARGAGRELVVVRTLDGGAWAELQRTAYILPGTRLSGRVETNVAALAELEGSILLAQGDTLLLTRSLEPGRGALRDAAGRLLAQARIGCTLPEVFECVKVGEAVWLDDGRIGGKVREANADLLALEITHARPGGERLRADKGINLPDTAMNLPALTTKDLRDLEFVARHADAVALSFVHAPEDIDLLEDRLRELGRPELGIVLKIETRRAFDQLPQLLLASLQSPSSGVMIARGDLAVECGFERLAEIQEEILWIAEAAHIPVIWATQVLETLAKTGRPSRAEITDAAMGERAECVMLNKGPHIETAVRVLDDILRRMEGHQRKKSPRLRPLRLAHRLGEGGAGES